LLSQRKSVILPVGTPIELEQEGSNASDWGASENNGKARFYQLTRRGRKQLQDEARSWEQTATIIERFFAAKAEDLE
jgi:PadR family transcriptional regulator PadR